MPDEPSNPNATDAAAMLNEIIGSDAEQIVEPVESTTPEPAPSVTSGGSPEPDRLAAALETIKSLQASIADMQMRQERIQAAERFAPTQPMEQIEYEETLPGRRIPKDPSRHPIRIKPEDLVRLGWNEDPAGAINKLANTFYQFIMETVPQVTVAATSQFQAERSAAERRRSEFHAAFPDLVDFADLATIVERQAIDEGAMSGKTQQQWHQEVGARTRSRIAAMRGITLDQYVASVGASSTAKPAPRAVTSGTQVRRAAPSPNEQMKEMQDLMPF